MGKIKVTPVGIDGWGRVVFQSATGGIWKTIELYDPDTALSWDDLTALYDSDNFDGEPGFSRPIGDFELIEDVLWHLQTWEDSDAAD